MPPARRYTPLRQTIGAKCRLALVGKELLELIRSNIPIEIERRWLNKASIVSARSIRIGTARLEDAASVMAQPVRNHIQLQDGNMISIRNGMDGQLGLIDSPTFLTRGPHVLPRLSGIEAKEFFFVGADVVFSEAFNSVAKRPNINALHTMRVKAPGDRTPKLATLLGRGGQAVPECSQGSTGNK